MEKIAPVIEKSVDMSQQELLNIVILGGSFGGLSAAHHFLEQVMYKTTDSKANPAYRVIIVSPSTHIYWNIGAPRALVSPRLVPTGKSFLPIADGFSKYQEHEYKFIQGAASSWDTEARTVTVTLTGKLDKRASKSDMHSIFSTASGTKQLTLPYHALVNATGSSAYSSLLSLHGPHEKTISALESFHAKILTADTILIVGGGPSGVETAGQIATFFNRGAGLPFFRRPGLYAKKITLLSGTDRLLNKLSPKLGIRAEKQLTRLGVKVIHNVRLAFANEQADGKVACRLSNDSTITTDLYIACTGVVPNTAFVPRHLLDENGYIITNPSTLRVESAGPRVYAIGDCASNTKNYVLDVYQAIPTLMHNLRNDLIAHELHLQSPYGGNEERIKALEGEDAAFVPEERDSYVMPITRRGGVGVVMGWRLPSLMVWLVKGRDYRIGKARGVVREGENPYPD